MHWIDATHLPETKGVVDRFLLNGRGEADGMLLRDGLEVHFPAHLAPQVLGSIKPGASVKLHGLRPRGVDMLLAVQLQAADGTQITDDGARAAEAEHPGNPGRKRDNEHHHPEHKSAANQPEDRREEMRVEGVVERVLHGSRGRVRGALLKDGRIICVNPASVPALHGLLAPGRHVVAHGRGLVGPLGTVLDAQRLGTTEDTLEHVGHKANGHG